MIVRKPRPEARYYILPHEIANDRRLSWRARGLLIYLLCKPDNWTLSVSDLINQTKESASPTGRDSVYSTINELIAAGYVYREQGRSDDGVLGSVRYVVTEEPHPENTEAVPHRDSPHTDKPDTDEPDTANPTLISIEENKVLNDEQGITSARRCAAKVRKARIEFDQENAQLTGITDELRGHWAAAYPLVNIDAEITRAAVWLFTNPDRRKQNYARFLTNWFSRSQERAASKPVASKNRAQQPMAEWLNEERRRMNGNRGGDDGRTIDI